MQSNRKALCIGIDKYPNPDDRLGGCVNDAKAWEQEFRRRGFQTSLLVDGEATRSGMLDAMRNLIKNSQSGDVVAIQYSGHGTQVTDWDGDEESDGKDEALVPFDHRHNGYLIDDDLAEVCNEIPAGVSVTFFMDSCHSGTVTRLFRGVSEQSAADVRIRYLRADREMEETHRRTCETNRKPSTRSRSHTNREILFSACRSNQTAKERGGQGDFSRFALQILRGAADGVKNSAFLDAIYGIGVFEDQNPQLCADPSLIDETLLGQRARQIPGATMPGSRDSSWIRSRLLEIVNQL